jgi:hypothetical protein
MPSPSRGRVRPSWSVLAQAGGKVKLPTWGRVAVVRVPGHIADQQVAVGHLEDDHALADQ